MKRIILVLALILLNFNTNAQNITMAKAFYKKAQQEYENKNYEEVILLLKKSSEMMDGQINPDMIYLGAMTRYYSDLNINTAKYLLNTFLSKAHDDDYRKNEVSDLLVEIETSDNFYENGNRKIKEVYHSINKKTILYYSSEGIRYKLENYIDNELAYILIREYINNEFIDSYEVNLETIEGKYYYYKKINGLVENYTLFEKKPKKIEYTNKKIKVGNVYIQVKIPQILDNPTRVKNFYNGELRQEWWHSNNSDGFDSYLYIYYKDFKDFDELLYWDYLVAKHSENYSVPKFEILETYPNGMIKKLFEKERDGTSNEVIFSEDGFPKRLTNFKKNGKIYQVAEFDKESRRLSYLNKKDW